MNFVSDTQDAFLFWDGYGLIRGDKNGNGKYKIPDQFKIFEDFPPYYWDKFPHDSYHEQMMYISKNIKYFSKHTQNKYKGFVQRVYHSLPQISFFGILKIIGLLLILSIDLA